MEIQLVLKSCDCLWSSLDSKHSELSNNEDSQEFPEIPSSPLFEKANVILNWFGDTLPN